MLVDANHVCWFTDAYVDAEMKEREKSAATIPVIDLVSEFNFPDSVYHARWTACHRQFADAQPNRQGIFAYGSGHVIFRDNPSLVISAIVKAYSGVLGKEQWYKKMPRGGGATDPSA